MQKEYNERDFDDADITCPKCGWHGKGSDAVIIDFFGVVGSKEAHCPKCDTKLCIVKSNDKEDESGGDTLSNQFG